MRGHSSRPGFQGKRWVTHGTGLGSWPGTMRLFRPASLGQQAIVLLEKLEFLGIFLKYFRGADAQESKG